jgi:glutaredoxin
MRAAAASQPPPVSLHAEARGFSLGFVVTTLLAVGALAGVALLAFILVQNDERAGGGPEVLAVGQDRPVMQRGLAAEQPATQPELAVKSPAQAAAAAPTPAPGAPPPGTPPDALEPPVEGDPAVLAARTAEDERRHQEVMAAIAARERARATSSVAITMYSTSWCGACKKARDHMRAQGIAFDERDVDDDPAAKAQQLLLNPSGSVPTIDIDGREVLVGFGASHLDAAINRSVARRTGS